MSSGTPYLPDRLLQPLPGSPPGYTFRLAGRSDIGPLHATCFADRPFKLVQRDLERMLVRQSAGRAYLLLAERANPAAVAGSVQLLLHRQRGEIANLFVTQAYRNQGVGTTLLAIMVEVGRYLSLELLEVGVENDNAQAVRMYRRLGFAEDRTMKVPGRGLATIMVMELRPSSSP
jgi:ribosomal protein S18 acetylase RimI-like enzyme